MAENTNVENTEKVESPSKTNRKWKPEETKMLVEQVEANYKFLTDGVNPGKSRDMINKKWAQITYDINSLGLHPVKIKGNQAKRKWIDLKSKCKSKVSKWNTSRNKTGGGPSDAIKPTDFEFRVAKIIPEINVTGVPGLPPQCDTGAANSSTSVSGQISAASQVLDVPLLNDPYNMPSPAYSPISALLDAAAMDNGQEHHALVDNSYFANQNQNPSSSYTSLNSSNSELTLGSLQTPLTPSTTGKVPKATKRDIHEQIMEIDKAEAASVEEIRQQLTQTNGILQSMVDEMRRNNEANLAELQRSNRNAEHLLSVLVNHIVQSPGNINI